VEISLVRGNINRSMQIVKMTTIINGLISWYDISFITCYNEFLHHIRFDYYVEGVPLLELEL
jgi:hypothetical protein